MVQLRIRNDKMRVPLTRLAAWGSAAPTRSTKPTHNNSRTYHAAVGSRHELHTHLQLENIT